jgi:hypothetical protein
MRGGKTPSHQASLTHSSRKLYHAVLRSWLQFGLQTDVCLRPDFLLLINQTKKKTE